jgi:hypothetical protein
MNTRTRARPNFRYSNRPIRLAIAKYSERRPRIAKMF